MPQIKIATEFNAPIQLVFDACRDIDLHQLSASETREKAIFGKTSGLINLNESVTWRAKHFGIYQKLTVVITKMEIPVYFQDKMTKGVFKEFTHDHYFETVEGKTHMFEVFDYTAPLGFLGKLADRLFLERYMTSFLVKRNARIKNHLDFKE